MAPKGRGPGVGAEAVVVRKRWSLQVVAHAKAGRQGCPGGRGKAALVARSQGKSQGRAPGLPLGPRQGAVWPRDRVVVLLRVAARVAWSRSRELGIARTGVARSGIASSGVEIRRHESRRERRPEPVTEVAPERRRRRSGATVKWGWRRTRSVARCHQHRGVGALGRAARTRQRRFRHRDRSRTASARTHCASTPPRCQRRRGRLPGRSKAASRRRPAW